jgi:hypothetical protein
VAVAGSPLLSFHLYCIHSHVHLLFTADATANSAALITLMQFWVKIKAESLSIPHSLLSGIDSASLKQLIAAPDSPSSPLLNSWQKDAVGDDLLKLKSGSVALAWNPNTRSIQLVDVKL